VQKVIPLECLVNGGISFNGTHNCENFKFSLHLNGHPRRLNFQPGCTDWEWVGNQPVLVDSNMLSELCSLLCRKIIITIIIILTYSM